ncbi:MAG: dehydrogenase [Bacteroidaceae bacterium]|nr:dehydrogenase [Bacteroidaceae bacterium]
MADNYLEKHYEDYLKRKAAWEKSRKHSNTRQKPERPEDESL